MNGVSADGLRCAIEGEDQLPAETGGEAGVCAAVARAVLPEIERAGIAPASVSVTVTVASPYAMAATASVGGRALPEQKVGISDRPLNARAVQMLADALARELASLGK